MKNLVKLAVALAVLLPGVALAQANMAGGAHDLSTGSSSVASDNDQICVFCHAPHHANSTRLLWNNGGAAAAAYNWTDTTTLYGTALPTTLNASSVRCFTCHDGASAVSDLYSMATDPVMSGGNAAEFTAATGTVVSGGRLDVALGAANDDLTGNHPVSIPYAGEVTYRVGAGDVTSSATVGVGRYEATTNVGCTSASGFCTAAGLAINLIPDAEGDLGVECTTCHNVHGGAAPVKLLVVVNTGSALCISCHDK